MFFVIGKVVGNRVALEDEINGLDIPEMGVLGYSADSGPLPAGAGERPMQRDLPMGARIAKPAPSL